MYNSIDYVSRGRLTLLVHKNHCLIHLHLKHLQKVILIFSPFTIPAPSFYHLWHIYPNVKSTRAAIHTVCQCVWDECYLPGLDYQIFAVPKHLCNVEVLRNEFQFRVSCWCKFRCSNLDLPLYQWLYWSKLGNSTTFFSTQCFVLQTVCVAETKIL